MEMRRSVIWFATCTFLIFAVTSISIAQTSEDVQRTILNARSDHSSKTVLFSVRLRLPNLLDELDFDAFQTLPLNSHRSRVRWSGFDHFDFENGEAIAKSNVQVELWHETKFPLGGGFKTRLGREVYSYDVALTPYAKRNQLYIQRSSRFESKSPSGLLHSIAPPRSIVSRPLTYSIFAEGSKNISDARVNEIAFVSGSSGSGFDAVASVEFDSRALSSMLDIDAGKLNSMTDAELAEVMMRWMNSEK